MRSYHRHLTAYQVSCEVGQSIILILRPAILDRQILAFDVPAFADALPECGHKTCSVGGRRAAEEPDYRHRWLLLCARRERPRGRAAERQQFPPPDGDCHTRLPCEVRKGNDTTPRACCPNSAAPGTDGGARQAQATTERRPVHDSGLISITKERLRGERPRIHNQRGSR